MLRCAIQAVNIVEKYESEQFYLSRVEPPQWFKAPSNVEDTCRICGEAIQPGQIIGESDEQYVHEDCLISQMEEEKATCR